MCKLVSLNTGSQRIKVADIKKSYIENIINSVRLCSDIDKVVLFGSALEERCTDYSDVDIAVFGRKSKAKMFRSKSYNEFVDSISSYGDIQDYDVLYFDIANAKESSVMNEIERGVVLYERK